MKGVIGGLVMCALLFGFADATSRFAGYFVALDGLYDVGRWIVFTSLLVAYFAGIAVGVVIKDERE